MTFLSLIASLHKLKVRRFQNVSFIKLLLPEKNKMTIFINIWKVPFWNLLIFKGTSLSIEKLASLFLFYATCCVVSLIILLMEIFYKPAKPTIEKINERPFTQHDFNLQLEALQKKLEWLAANNGKKNLGNHTVDLALIMRLQKTVAATRSAHCFRLETPQ